jgi:hypothetical protein
MLFLLLLSCSVTFAVPVTFVANGTVPPQILNEMVRASERVPVVLNQPMVVQVTWQSLEVGLAYTIATWSTNFTRNVVAALHLARRGQRVDDTYDAVIIINSNIPWWLGDDCVYAGATSYDLQSAIIHELMHALCMSSRIDRSRDLLNLNKPNDTLSEYDFRLRCLAQSTVPTVSQLINCVTVDGLQLALDDGTLIWLYAPAVWSASSVVHFDPYYRNTADNVMVPQIGPGECRRSLGPALLSLMSEMGYQVLPPTPNVATTTPTLISSAGWEGASGMLILILMVLV